MSLSMAPVTKAILAYAEQISADNLAPLTIAILAKDYSSYICKLHDVWQQQQRPWHILVVDRQYTQQGWKRLEKDFPHLTVEKILPMRGIQRVDIVPYRFSVTMFFDDSEQAWSALMAQIHIFILLDGNAQDFRQALRMSVPNPLLYSERALSDEEQECLQQQQIQFLEQIPLSNALAEKDKVGGLYYLNSRRPEQAKPSQREAIVIGAGVAGAGVAFALAHRGWKVKIFDPLFLEGPDEMAYRYASGAVTPLLTADDCFKARLSRAGVLRAHARWKEIEAGINYCGTLELNRDKGHAKELLTLVREGDFPKEWVHLVSAKEAQTLARLELEQEGAYFPLGMQVPPVRLAWALVQHPNISAYPFRVNGIYHEGERSFCIQTDYGSFSSEVLIVATAMQSLSLLENSQFSSYTLKSGKTVKALKSLDSLHALAGEVMMVPASALKGGPQCVIGGQGYYLPAQEGFCVMGSTYEHGNLSPQVTSKGQESIWKKMPLSFPVSLEELQQQQCLKGRACVRAVLQGRLPIISPLPHYPHFWLTTAYASHGMTWSSLAGDIIGASLEGEPLPVERDLLGAVSLKI